MARALLGLAAVLALAGCTDERAPFWTTQCVEYRYDTVVDMVPMGTPLGSGLYLRQNAVCEKEQPVCAVGKDYKGPITSC